MADWAAAGLLVLIVTLALMLWNGMAERGCAERGGYIEWSTDRAASTASGRCVEP